MRYLVRSDHRRRRPARRWPPTERSLALSPSSESGFQIGEFGICYTEGRSAVASGLCLVAALVALASLLGMIAAFSWHPLRLDLLWPALAALTFSAFAMFMIALALAPPQVLTFDATRRQVRGRTRRRSGLPRHCQLDFEALHSPRLQTFTVSVRRTPS